MTKLTTLIAAPHKCVKLWHFLLPLALYLALDGFLAVAVLAYGPGFLRAPGLCLLFSRGRAAVVIESAVFAFLWLMSLSANLLDWPVVLLRLVCLVVDYVVLLL